MIAFETFKVKKWYGYLENVILAQIMGHVVIVRTLSSRNSFFGSVMVDFLNNAVFFMWDFTITMQTKNLTAVSVTKLLSIKQNDKPGNRKNLFLVLSNIVNLGIIRQDL